jgi:2-hydroxy-3-oxopropionate reductase
VPDRVGLIGLGTMGGHMAVNLAAAEVELTVFTRNAERRAEFEGRGMSVVASAGEVAERSDVVITMVSDGPAVRDVLTGEDGVFAGMSDGGLVIEMSTIDPSTAEALAEEAGSRGLEMLDAPVSGGEEGARQGTLSIMVGGPDAAVERARPIFEILGKTITHVGGHGTGQTTKACNQIVVAATYAAISEALVLSARSGVDLGRMLDALSGGLAGSRIMELRRQKLLEHEFSPGFKVDLHHKDLRIAVERGDQLNVPLPLATHALQGLEELRALGHGGLDHSALLMIAERRAGMSS